MTIRRLSPSIAWFLQNFSPIVSRSFYAYCVRESAFFPLEMREKESYGTNVITVINAAGFELRLIRRNQWRVHE